MIREIKKESIKKEKKLAKQLALKVTKNSGALTKKADMQGDKTILEMKSSFAKKFRVKTGWVVKLLKECEKNDKEFPVLCVEKNWLKKYLILLDDYEERIDTPLIEEVVDVKASIDFDLVEFFTVYSFRGIALMACIPHHVYLEVQKEIENEH